jgi:curved DNA-binding protein CbpA
LLLSLQEKFSRFVFFFYSINLPFLLLGVSKEVACCVERWWRLIAMADRSRLQPGLALLQLLLLFLLLVSSVAEAKDLYKILGVDKNANDREIQKAFHKLSLKYHPDKNKAKNAEAKFSEISNAYEVLSDSEKRKQYDLTGDEKGSPSPGFGGGHSSSAYGGGSNFGGGNYGSGFGGPGGQRTFTFSYGAPKQEAQGGGPQGWQTFFTDSQYAKHSSKRKSSSESESGPSWAQNLFNQWTSFGNDRQDPSSNSRGRMFEGLFGSSFPDAFRQSWGESKGQGGPAQEPVKLPKGVEQLNAKKFKAQVLETARYSWAILFFMPMSHEISDRADVLTIFAEDFKGLMRVSSCDGVWMYHCLFQL